MTNSRTKGANGEREFAGLIYDHLGIKLVRNLEQSRSGGHDLIPVEQETLLDNYAIEIKRYQAVTTSLLKQWWQQTIQQAKRVNKTPVLAYRANRQDWQIVVPLHLINSDLSQSNSIESVAFLPMAGFCQIVRNLHHDK